MVTAAINYFFEIVHQILNLCWRLRHKGPYTIWFLVPRYHTNMIPMVMAFKEAGDTVKIIVTKQELIEDHQLVCPTNIRDILSEVKAKGKVKIPDILILRDLSSEMLELSRWAKNRGARIIHYTQKTSNRKKGYTAFRKDITRIRAKQLAGLPLSTITPLDNNPSFPKRLFHHTFDFPITDVLQCAPLRTSQLQILVVGKLAQPRKQHFWVIEALRELQIDCKLVICGANLDLEHDDGTRSAEYYYRLMATPNQYELNKKIRIEILPNVPRSDMAAIYLASDLFALPALDEVFGISVLEAMSYGCATITTDENGSSRHIESGTNGYIVSARDKTELKNKLEELMMDSVKRQNIQTEAIRTINKNHSIAQFREFILSRA